LIAFCFTDALLLELPLGDEGLAGLVGDDAEDAFTDLRICLLDELPGAFGWKTGSVHTHKSNR